MEVREAVHTAMNYVVAMQDLMPTAESARLEEIELDGNFWKVTLSFNDPGRSFIDERRMYKEFKIDSTSGQVVSMKVRKI